VDLTVGVANSRDKLALRTKLRNLNLISLGHIVYEIRRTEGQTDRRTWLDRLG